MIPLSYKRLFFCCVRSVYASQVASDNYEPANQFWMGNGKLNGNASTSAKAYNDKLATESYRSPLRRGVHSDEVSGDASCMLMMLDSRSWVSLEVLCRRFR